MLFSWEEVHWVLLDLDGTLLDKHFDDYFWETLVPEEFARRHGLSAAAARHEVFARYQRQEGTLNWTDIDFWSEELGLDIPALKESIRHLIEVHPEVEEFLQFLRGLGKKVVLVTNAHWRVLNLKMEQTGLVGYFDQVVSSFDLGAPKEELACWQVLQQRIAFQPEHTLLVDDNAEVLAAARRYGIRYLFFKGMSSSQLAPGGHPDFPVLMNFRELM